MDHPECTRAEWLDARRALQQKEKAFTRLREELAGERRALPWVRVTEDYRFATADGERTLADLFEGRSQLIVYHFMFGPDWEAGCKSCSFWADNFNGIVAHLAQRDIAFIAVSRAPLEKLQRFAKRLGWTFRWVSSGGSSFNYDYGVSFTQSELDTGHVRYNYGTHKAFRTDMPGISVFFKDDAGAVFHTYSCYSRGIDQMNTAYHYMDLVPKGRDEAGLPYTQAWVRHRDAYGT